MSRPDRTATRVGCGLRVIAMWSMLALSGPQVAHAQAADGLTVLSALQFGTIAVLGPGAVTIFAEGNRLAEGQTYFIGADSSQPAQVVVASRTAHMAFSLSLPDSFVLASDTGPATLMVSRLKSAPSPAITGPSATSTVSIGATLQFSSIPPPGRYSGNFQLAVIWP